jgi:AcrR family transcriptional regulator
MDDEFTFAGPRPSRADAVKNRAALVETARRLFAEQGVEAVSMTAIADAAGVGKGTLYRHFDSKAELCLALLDAEQHTLQDETLRRLSAQDSPLEKLKWFLESVVRFIARNDALLRVEHGPSGPPALAHPAHLWWRQTIAGLLRQCLICPDSDVESRADVLYAMLDIHTQRYLRHVRGYGLPRVIALMHDLLDRLLR